MFSYGSAPKGIAFIYYSSFCTLYYLGLPRPPYY